MPWIKGKYIEPSDAPPPLYLCVVVPLQYGKLGVNGAMVEFVRGALSAFLGNFHYKQLQMMANEIEISVPIARARGNEVGYCLITDGDPFPPDAKQG